MNFDVSNKSYCATVVQIADIRLLEKGVGCEKCDNVVGARVAGFHVIVPKSTEPGDIGIFFPVECRLSDDFLKNNNCYREKTLNADAEVKPGYFEPNRRLKCMRFRGHSSDGMFMTLDSLKYLGVNLTDFNLGNEFNSIDGKLVCEKFMVAPKCGNLNGQGKNKPSITRVSRLVEGQFRLHIDTEQLKKNMFKVEPNTLVSLSGKIHGTSAVVGKVLVKKKLKLKDRIAKYFGVNVIDTEYDGICASRNVIKNEHFKDCKTSFYKDAEGKACNVWEDWCNRLKPLLPAGMTLYGEIVGYVAPDSFIQKGYHYGQLNGTNEFYAYRITMTTPEGKVFELNRLQIDEFCQSAGIKTTPLFFFGYAKDIYPDIATDEHWHENVLARMETDERLHLNNIMCPMNNGEVPAEGCVLRTEMFFHPQPFKLKNYKFIKRESDEMDTGEMDLETMETLGLSAEDVATEEPVNPVA